MITRRTWLGGAAVGLGATLLPGACDDPSPPGRASSIVLEVDDRSALIVVWSETAARLSVALARPDGTPAGRWHSEVGDNGVGHVAARNLAPGTRYVAVVWFEDGRVLDAHSFVTAPADDDPRPVRLSWSADIDPDPAYDSPIFETLADQRADLFVSLGDWPYADNGGLPTSADGYRERYVEARTLDKLQRWLHGTSVRAMLDDHEVRNDWDAATFAADPALHQTALAVWDEWFPRAVAGPRYRRWRWGAHVECFLLDTRTYRSANADPDRAGKTMLGDAQRAWLIDGVTTSRASFKLVFSTVPLDFGHGYDHWAGYRTERDEILDALADAATPGVVFLSGDQHWFAAYRHRLGAREFQVGPLARGPLPLPPWQPGILARSAEYSFGLLDVSADGLQVRALGAGGAVLWDERFRPDELTLRPDPPPAG